MVEYVGVHNMTRLIAAVGIEPFLIGLADYITADFVRWHKLAYCEANSFPFFGLEHCTLTGYFLT